MQGTILTPTTSVIHQTLPCLADLFDEPELGLRVGDRVGGHVEQQEVLLLGGEDALLHQVLGQPLAHVAQLVAQLQRVPRLTWAGRWESLGTNTGDGT